jgi:SAM-dependent methyltransferase
MLDKINLGCGDKKEIGFLNVDGRQEVYPDIVMDIMDLSRFKDNTFSYIKAHDVFEHIPHPKVWPVLTEWVRCLKKDGILEIQVPSIDRIIRARNKLIQDAQGDSSLRFSQLIFGGQTYAANFHYVCYTIEFFELATKKLPIKILEYIPEIGKFNHQVYFIRF